MTGVGAVIAATTLMMALRWLPRTGCTRLVAAYGVLACMIAHLATDDATIHRPLSLEDFSPAFAGAEESYEVLMRYGKAHPLGQGFRFQRSSGLKKGEGGWMPKHPQWSAWLISNRIELERGWAELEPVRSWWAELNTFDRIGDLTPPRLDAEIMTFAPVRVLSQHACAIASLQALDGNGDAAIATLMPILEVSRKLEPSSRTLVRSMMARVAQKLALETAWFVLGAAEVSPVSRARLSRALVGGSGGEEGARRLVSMEYAWGNVILGPWRSQQVILGNEALAQVRRRLSSVELIVFNSRRTLNLYGELTLELQGAAAARRAGEIDAVQEKFFQRQGRIRFKNCAGLLTLSRMTPAYKKIVENYWLTEDLRSALHQRLEA
jgi:hypothetical protein